MPDRIEFPPELLPKLTSALGEYACRGSISALEQCAFSEETEKNGEYIRILAAQMLSGKSDRALYMLGDCFECGYGAKKDPQAARRCYTEAMQRGYGPAEIDLGHMDLDEDRFSDALAHFQNAMKKQETLDETSLRRCYKWMGETYQYREEPDYRKALECYTIAAERYQDSEAIYALGMLYQEENSGFFNPQKALANLQTAEKMHHRGAALFLAEYCIDGYPKLNISKDYDQAERYLLPYLDDDDREVLTDLGGIYLHKAEAAHSKPDALKAVDYLLKAWALEQNNTTALDLGCAYVWAGDSAAAEPYLEYADRFGEYRMSQVLGGRYWERGENEKALSCFSHAFENRSLTNKGYVAEYLKLLEEAEQYDRMGDVLNYAVGYLRDSVFSYIECRLILSNKLYRPQLNKAQAAEILEELAEESAGDQLAGCHRLLGDYYHEIHKDNKAFDHWKNAFQLGSAECAVSLGKLAETGYGVVPPNITEAYSWFCKAADAGNELGKKEKACFRMVTVPNGLHGQAQKYQRVYNLKDMPTDSPPTPRAAQKQMFCRFCGAKLVPGGRFCGKCGKPIG